MSMQTLEEIQVERPAARVVGATKAYFSRSMGLTFYSAAPRQVMHEGRMVVLDGKKIQFSAINQHWGRVVFTVGRDDEQIAAIEQRIAESREVGQQSDVYTEDEWMALQTTPEQRLKDLQGTLESERDASKRTIENQNRLIDDLRRKAEAAEAAAAAQPAAAQPAGGRRRAGAARGPGITAAPDTSQMPDLNAR